MIDNLIFPKTMNIYQCCHLLNILTILHNYRISMSTVIYFPIIYRLYLQHYDMYSNTVIHGRFQTDAELQMRVHEFYIGVCIMYVKKGGFSWLMI